ncbi:hypothetical protein [Actinomadura fibrosa]|uniref:Uncharacterized protein n=1 Tax=Actinomadura fibrosa TaxID=111802 RepID=A0ABW2XCN8_9ACTN|nr:hypothetical protein [Actinomadura fibrosa]
MFAAGAFVTALATGCGGDGGGTSSESPAQTRSVDQSPSRAAGVLPERSTAPQERDTPADTVTAAPTEAQGASSDGSGASSLVGLWIALAASLVVLVAWLVYVMRKRSEGEQDWNAKAVRVWAQGANLRDAIRTVELLTPGAEVSVRWGDIQRLADDMNKALHVLRETAITEDEHLRADDALAALDAVRMTMATERSLDGVDAARSRSMQANLQTLDYTLGALRARATV